MKTVLFVDDDARILKAWARAFNPEPYTIITAQNGSEAKQILRNMHVSLVVTDYSMPRGDGLDLLKFVNSSHPDVTKIMVTGEATVKVASEAINEYGIFRLFEKPCPTPSLASAIRQGLNLTNDTNAEEVQKLEEEFPGISKVRRTRTGIVLL